MVTTWVAQRNLSLYSSNLMTLIMIAYPQVSSNFFVFKEVMENYMHVSTVVVGQLLQLF